MTIKEIETQTGMERANIRFYEREGLISPARGENGYRDYSEKDAAMLLRVKLLRSLHISLEEIKALKNGTAALSDTLARQIALLEQEKDDAAFAQETCRAMQSDKVAFAELDAKKYLDAVKRNEAQSGSAYFTVFGERIEQVFRPWRRYFARSLDFSLYSLVWWILLAFAFRASRSAFFPLPDLILSTLFMLFIEPLLLHRFGTTPGKAILGLRITDPKGKPLSYGDALARTWGVLGKGMGYQIPIFNLVRLYKSYKRCDHQEVQPWDEDNSYTVEDVRAWRAFAYIGASALTTFLLIAVILSRQLPLNRGALTVSQFAENYNDYMKYYGYGESAGVLNADGTWRPQTEAESSTFDFFGNSAIAPVFSYEEANGILQAVTVTFALDEERNYIAFPSYETKLMLASFSFALAQRDAGLFSDALSSITKQIDAQPFGTYQFTQAGVAFTCETAYTGYIDQSGTLISESLFSENKLSMLQPEGSASAGGEETEQSFLMVFTMEMAD